ncbi:MAG: hypothetical protein WKF92_11795 [Pyrinomonadaceae bacterium]
MREPRKRVSDNKEKREVIPHAASNEPDQQNYPYDVPTKCSSSVAGFLCSAI